MAQPDPPLPVSGPGIYRCPCCGEMHRIEPLGRIGRWDAAWCRTCDHRWLLTSDFLERSIADVYEAGYRGHTVDAVFEGNLESEIDQVIAPVLAPGAAILDVGCGNGSFLAAAQRRGFAAEGVDISENAVAFCRNRGVTAHVADFTALTGRDGDFALVTFWDVLEHLLDPGVFLAKAREVLEPGGLVLLKVPLATAAATALGGRVSRLAGPVLHAPKHVQYFNHSSVRALLQRSGFEVAQTLPSRPLRGHGRDSRGTVAKAKRAVVRGLLRATGCGNIYLLAKSTRTS